MIPLGRLYRVMQAVHQCTQEGGSRGDIPLSETNRADTYVGMLNSSVYQLFVFPVEVAMEVRVQVALVVWEVHKCIREGSLGLEYAKLGYTAIDLGRGPGGGGWWMW